MTETDFVYLHWH